MRVESPVRVSTEKLGVKLVKTFNSEISQDKAKYLENIRNSQIDFMEFENFIAELLDKIYEQYQKQPRKLCSASLQCDDVIYI